MPQHIGERILIRRKELGFSQHQLSRLSGIRQGQISRYELGEHQPQSDLIIAIARALQTTPHWLMGYSDSVSGDELNEEEKELLAIFRSKPPHRYSDILEILRRV
jgi:transcriptional regulator with XRE-family HTH domain